MEPADIEVDELVQGVGMNPGSELGLGFWVGFADGEVWRLHPNTPIATLCNFGRIRTCKQHDRQQDLGAWCLGKFRNNAENK